MTQLGLLSRIQGCLMGVQVGDALGAPWEIMTPAEILAATNGEGVITFHDNVQTKIKDTANLKAGQTTDDWQLTRALARSLIHYRQFNLTDVAVEQIKEMLASDIGFGGTTKKSLTEIKAYFDSQGICGRSPAMPATELTAKRGSGNGVAMKVAPLAILYSADINFTETLFKPVWELGRMTHADVRASYAAYALADLLAYLFNSNDQPLIFLSELSQVITDVRRHENQKRGDQDPGETFSARLTKLTPEILADPDQFRKIIGTSCFCMESVPFAIGTFLRHPRDFQAGVLEAINAGGDTDTTAAMVGALIGANIGLAGIPTKWQQFRPEFTEALQLGRKLFEIRSLRSIK